MQKSFFGFESCCTVTKIDLEIKKRKMRKKRWGWTGQDGKEIARSFVRSMHLLSIFLRNRPIPFCFRILENHQYLGLKVRSLGKVNYERYLWKSVSGFSSSLSRVIWYRHRKVIYASVEVFKYPSYGDTAKLRLLS